MNICVATSSVSAVPLLAHLSKIGYLRKIIIPERYLYFEELFGRLFPSIQKYVFSKSQCLHYNLNEDEDFLITFGFPYKMKPLGNKSLNIHFGELPELRGPMPVFWAMKQGKRIVYVCIHELTDKFDQGSILSQKSYPVYPGESYGMLNARLGSLCIEQVMGILQNYPVGKKQDESLAKYYPKVSEQDTKIDWTKMSSHAIEDLVNACNPTFNGASTTFNNTKFNILEAFVPDHYKLNNVQLHRKAGSIIQANQQGLAVKCMDNKPLVVTVAALSEGVFSGSKLVQMGFNEKIQFV